MRVHGYLNFELAFVCLENFIFHGLLKYSGSDIPFSDGIVWMFFNNTFCYIFCYLLFVPMLNGACFWTKYNDT